MTGPRFGRARRADFLLAEGVAPLNHGAYGATPRIVLAASDRWRAQMEADPSTFFRRDLPRLLRAAAARVAGFLGGRGEDWAFVENATTGMNAIIESVPLQQGDELLCLSQVYGAVGNTLRFRAERTGARVVSVPVPVPFADPAPLLASLKAAITPRTRLAAFDHVTSPGAIVLPVREMIALCRRAGVPVAIDGAHAAGMLPLHVPELGADWYVTNLHKWAFAPRGTAVIWCAPARQDTLHPVAISHYLGQGFNAEFDYSGTRDNSPWLASGAALDYYESLGGEALRAHNNALANEAGELLAKAWGSPRAALPPYCGSMAAVALPGAPRGNRLEARALATRLTEEHGFTLGVMVLDGGLWIRVSAQVYNEIGEYERLADVGRKIRLPAA
jgi:isopenicillin-N epimerase